MGRRGGLVKKFSGQDIRYWLQELSTLMGEEELLDTSGRSYHILVGGANTNRCEVLLDSSGSRHQIECERI